MAVRAQTSIEFLLILSAVVLVILAGVMSLSEITRMQQSAYSTAQVGVENASTGLLTYLSNETFGTGFYPISGGTGEYTNASLVSLEITKSEPYYIYQPSVIQLTAWNNYPAPMKIPKLLIWIVNSSGNETQLSISEEDNVTVILSHTLTATFVPTNSGVYNVTVVAQDENGSTLINPNTNELVMVKTNFTVLDARPPTSGFIRTFNIEKEVAVDMYKNPVYLETFSLPQNAEIFSAVLEITEPHLYENRSAGARAYYHYSQISECYCPQGTTCSSLGVTSTNLFSQPGIAEVPEDGFITGASYSVNLVSGSAAKIAVNGVNDPVAGNVVKTGTNTITLSINPAHNPCPSSPPSSSHESYIASGDASFVINYFAPAAETSDPSQVTGVRVNDNSLSAYTMMDITKYLRGGENTLSFGIIQGSFKYKLVVSYAET